MQAYAEGFDILRNASSDDAARGVSLRLRSRGDRRALASRQRRELVAARSRGAGARRRSASSKPFTGRVGDSGEGRWTVQAAIDEAVPGRGADRGALHAVPLATRPHVRREAAVGAARAVRRPCRAPALTPCVLVIFGASGDLTRRKLLPAIYNLAESRASSRRSSPSSAWRVRRSMPRPFARRCASACAPRRVSRSTRRSGSASRSGSTTCPVSSTTRRSTRRCSTSSSEIRAPPSRAAELPVLPGRPTRPVRHGRQATSPRPV